MLLAMGSRAVIAVAVLSALLDTGFAAPAPEITPPPALVLRNGEIIVQRDDVGSYLGSVFSSLGSDVSSYVASGVAQFGQDLPTGSAVMSKLSITDSDLQATPTQVLNLPPYGNWTGTNDGAGGWQLRLHGNVFKQPNISESKLNDLANDFLIGTKIQDLPPAKQSQARNLTAEIYVVQQAKVNVTMTFVNDVTINPGENGGALNGLSSAPAIQLPFETTDEGDFDALVTIQNVSSPDGKYLVPGNETTYIQTLNVYTEGTTTGNATAYLVPPKGITIVSDIDDILRVTKIYAPKEGLYNTFAEPFTPWMNMPEIYANLSHIPNFHFHYLTTTPEQITRNYMDFIYKTYPLGSFDTRPLNFSNVDETLSVRKYLLDKVFETFPQRRFILVGDTSNSDIMRDYPQLAKDHPGQVCIWLRNTTGTDSEDHFPYDTSGFQNVSQSDYMFFLVPDDLKHLDVANGECYNKTIKQNVTFSEQGLPFGIGNAAAGRQGIASGVTFSLGVMVMMVALLA